MKGSVDFEENATLLFKEKKEKKSENKFYLYDMKKTDFEVPQF